MFKHTHAHTRLPVLNAKVFITIVNFKGLNLEQTLFLSLSAFCTLGEDQLALLKKITTPYFVGA